MQLIKTFCYNHLLIVQIANRNTWYHNVQATAENISITVYRPLVMGLLAGKYKPGEKLPADSRGQTDKRIPNWLSRYSAGIRKFLEFASQHQISPAELAISWIRYSPAVTCPIVGVSSLSQLKTCTGAFDFDLSEKQYCQLTEMFDTDVKEESGGEYKTLRRHLLLLERN